MRVSVIIPVYNVERYLARCLDSVLAAADRLAATGHSAEIICVDDGSTDGSAAVLRRYSDRLRVISKPNGGLGSARNAGLDAMTGDAVMFVDSDDWVPPQSMSRFVEVAEASGAKLVVSTAFAKDVMPRTRSGGWRLRPSSWIAGRKVQYSACNKLYWAELWEGRRYPATIFEDFPVTTGVFCDVGEFAALDEPLYVYCTNGGATSLVRSPFTERKLRDSMTVVRMVLEHVAKSADRRAVSFAHRQAADGLSSTVGQVYKARRAELDRLLVAELDALYRDCPFLRGQLALKARYREWRVRRRNMI